METKINIAAILKDKPKGIKLYSPIFGNLRYEDLVPDLGEFTVVTSDNTSAKHSFRSDSRYNRHGESLMLLPSKEMRDWEKFDWKKGDVLVHKDGTVHIIFEGFEDDTYRTFKGKYYLWEDNGHIEQFDDHQHCMETSVFIKANDDAKTYINTIEERLGGKLNHETLEIEKAQPEFKDGDILAYPSSSVIGKNYIFILKEFNKYKGFKYYVALTGFRELDFPKYSSIWSRGDKNTRYATEEEKQQLFDALAKEGKAWDAEKKEVVNLKPKCELKPFDKVLVKDNPYGSWNLALFWKRVDAKDLHPYMVIGGKRYRFCEPYEGNEHFLDD